MSQTPDAPGGAASSAPAGPSDPAAVYAAERDRLWDTTVSTLTAATRLTHPEYGQLDLADFLASALAAVAGNLGSTSRLTAGRPGSWEADLVDQLVKGTAGHDAVASDLARYRTEPVTVPLNVSQLVWETWENAADPERAAMILPLEEASVAIDQVDQRWDDEHPAPPEGATTEQLQAHETAYLAQTDRSEAAQTDLRRRYTAAYETYAARFAAAVADAAREIAGLTVPTHVQALTDPDPDWTAEGSTPNPSECDDGDQLAAHLWELARSRVGLPTLDQDSPGEA